VIEVFKRDVDRRLLREALKMTPGDRLMNLQRLCECAEEVRRAVRKRRPSDDRLLVSHSTTAMVFGVQCVCLDLDTLIAVKRAAGRPKNFAAIAELEALREERGP
jgi:hypothetical protein